MRNASTTSWARSRARSLVIARLTCVRTVALLTTQRWALLTESFLEGEESSGFNSYYRAFLLARVALGASS